VPSFEFDPAEAAANLKKHRVSFDEAATVFDDPLSSTLPDDQHSEDENRFITVGMSIKQRLLFVVYTEEDSRIRLIGARPVTAAEREQYEQA
jgi:uncharacterized DUF497 family protein